MVDSSQQVSDVRTKAMYSFVSRGNLEFRRLVVGRQRQLRSPKRQVYSSANHEGTTWGSRSIAPLVLNPSTRCGESPASRLGCFFPGERTPGTH